MAARTDNHRNNPRGTGTIVHHLRVTLATAGGKMVAHELIDAGIALTGKPKPSVCTMISKMKKDGEIRYTPTRDNLYPITMTRRGVERAAMTRPVNGGEHAAVAAAPSVSVPARVHPGRATVPQLEGPEVGVGVLLNGGRVALYVDGKRRDFTREEFGKTADFFAMFAGR